MSRLTHYRSRMFSGYCNTQVATCPMCGTHMWNAHGTHVVRVQISWTTCGYVKLPVDGMPVDGIVCYDISQ